jgi:arylsulfatase A-like enzyme
MIRESGWFVLLALAACSSAPPSPEPPPAQRPNLLFFFTDDQRNDTLGCAGHPVVETPNIDRLAAEGVRFENAFVTTPICWVSRATILTGTWNRTTGSAEAIDVVRPEIAATFYPKLLHDAGYRTGFFGKWDAKFPEGFDKEAAFDVYEEIHRDPYYRMQPDGTLAHETELIGDRGVAFLESQPKDQPFSLQLWFNAAHAEDSDKRPGIGHFPWIRSLDGMYEDQVMPAPRLGDPAIFESQPEYLKKSINRERFFWRWDTPEKYQTNMRAYFRMITGIDMTMARVLAALEKAGLSDNTIIIYSADNGYYMGDRGFAGKWSHYEESLRVPMILFDPRLPEPQRGRVVSEMALNVDLPATFLDLAGVPGPEIYQGRSLMPLVRGAAPAGWRTDFLAEHLLEMRTMIPKWEGVRGQRYMYARYFEVGDEFLHDLQADPDQLKNFAEDPAYAKALAVMRSRTDQLREIYGGVYVPRSQRR